jgi:hypothetical protein
MADSTSVDSSHAWVSNADCATTALDRRTVSTERQHWTDVYFATTALASLPADKILCWPSTAADSQEYELRYAYIQVGGVWLRGVKPHGGTYCC